MADLLLQNPTLVPMDGPPGHPTGMVRTASIRIRGSRILEIGDLTAQPGETVVDAENLVALPGFVQTHLHFCQTIFRGLADDLALLDGLRERIWPFEAAHDLASVHASAQLSILELLCGGTTTVQVMESVRHTEACFEALRDSGMTAIVGNCLMDRDGPGVPAALVTSTDEAMRICEDLHATFHGVGRLHYAVTPRFLLSCSDELARNAAAFAQQHALRVHTHACEHPDEVDEIQRSLGVPSIVALRDHGLLGPRTGLAHCVHTTADERRILVETNTAVLHCPTANLKLGSGMAPIATYRDLGLRIGLGTDGAACNNRLSALTELRQAALVQAAASGPGTWPAEQALYAATRGGADALGLADDLGSLEIGKRADLVLVDIEELEPGGSEVSSVVYSATEQHVRHVVVGGEFAVRDGHPVRIDPRGVRAAARRAREDVLQRLAM